MKLGMRESSTFLPLIVSHLFYLSSNNLHSIEPHRIEPFWHRDSLPRLSFAQLPCPPSTLCVASPPLYSSP
jgi:hypothetical protein